MKEFYLVRITDPFNDIVVIVNQQFATFEDAKRHILTQYEFIEPLDDWSWHDTHDIYEIVRCKEVR